ncbi:MAG: hypothetical protein MJ233_05240 [Mycoplasmoidaceae bacterium]|nr:hypothetical protein [Mycoplasmoidaceae bacterium]
MQLYKVFVKAGIPFEPDSVNKCYTASFSDEIFENKASEQCSFYFKDKKVVKMVFASVTEDGEDYIKATEEVLMDYQEVKPGQVPEVVSYDVDGDSKFIHDESPKLTSSDFVVDTTKEFVFNIDTALYEDPTV